MTGPTTLVCRACGALLATIPPLIEAPTADKPRGHHFYEMVIYVIANHCPNANDDATAPAVRR